MRKFYHVRKTGSLKNIRQHATPILENEPGKVLVQVKAIGLNYADLFAIMGLYSATPKGTFIPGLEFCGVVLASDTERFAQGDPVIGVTRFGGYTTHIVADPHYLTPLPAGWSFEQGAAFPVQTLTAYYALKTLGDIRHGQSILIHSAAGGVGLQANSIAKKFDAYTIGVVGTASKLDTLKNAGYDKGIVRGHAFRRELVAALDGRELNLVLEATGGKYFRYSYDALAAMGRVVAYGSADFTPSSHRPNYITLAWKYLMRPRVDPLSMIPANKSVMGFNLIWLYERHEIMARLLNEISLLTLPPPMVGHTFAFDDLPEAISLFHGGGTTGKVVVIV
jgi:NADPH:quinone reductase-like Zn-dependent oxidoreductase